MSQRHSGYAQRDRALALAAVLAGLRADELVRANVGDIRVADDGGVIPVRGKANNDRRIPVKQALIDELATWGILKLCRALVRIGGRSNG